MLPGDNLSIKTSLPDQEMLVEANKSSNWPPLTLATIKNNNMDIHNNTNKLNTTHQHKTSTQTHCTTTITDALACKTNSLMQCDKLEARKFLILCNL